MSDQNSISVVIPVYNTERYLAEAIGSVLNQTLAAEEIIIVDDGSTDSTMEVAKKFEPAVRIINQPNKGTGTARNRGVLAARGNYLAFLDADDKWTSDKLEVQLAFLQEHPGIDMVFGNVEQFISPELSEEKHGNLRRELEKMPGFSAGTMLVKRETFLRVGMFNENLTIGEFIDWFTRAKDMGLTFHMFEEIMMQRRIHDANMGITKKDFKKDYTAVLREALARRRKASE